MPEHIRAEKRVALEFDFFAQPRALIGNRKVEAIEVERTEVVAGRAEGTGETYRIPAGLVVSCIGYRTNPIPDVPFDERAGHFANDEGRILPGLYAVGWARRGPSGTIGTNRPDGFDVIKKVREDLDSGALGSAGKQGRPGFDAMAEARGLDVVTFRDWKKIEEAEEKAARDGAPREKFVDIEAMIRARK
jgi:ferredoxin--NADP+ reductase